LIALGLAGQASPALASTTDDVLTAHDRAVIKFEVYTESDLENMPVDEWVALTTSTAEAIHADAAEVTSLAGGASKALGERIAELGAGLEDLAASLDALAAASDGDAAAAADAQMSAALDRLSAAEFAYDDYLAEHPSESGDTMWFVWTGLVVLSALCLVVAVILWARSGKLASQAPPLAMARRNLALAALIFFAGALITAVQYWNTEPGEEYSIFFYPLVIGGIWFFVALPAYLSQTSKAKQAVAAAGAAPGGAPYPPAPDQAAAPAPYPPAPAPYPPAPDQAAAPAPYPPVPVPYQPAPDQAAAPAPDQATADPNQPGQPGQPGQAA
jgi:hypothetical protein